MSYTITKDGNSARVVPVYTYTRSFLRDSMKVHLNFDQPQTCKNAAILSDITSYETEIIIFSFKKLNSIDSSPNSINLSISSLESLYLVFHLNLFILLLTVHSY